MDVYVWRKGTRQTGVRAVLVLRTLDEVCPVERNTAVFDDEARVRDVHPDEPPRPRDL